MFYNVIVMLAWSWDKASPGFTYSALLTGSPQFNAPTPATDFKTEEDLQSYLHESYQKTVATGGAVLHSCAQNMISTMRAFLKSKGSQDLEVREPDDVCCSHRHCLVLGVVMSSLCRAWR